MDSITQAVLGAAVGEAVLGKKLGNRAILWGGIAGTIPDLDVFSRLFITEPLYGLIYHRGLSHSILFTFVAPFLLAYLSNLYYKKGCHQVKIIQGISSGIWLFIYLAALAGSAYLAYKFTNIGSICLLSFLVFGLYFFINSLKKSRLLALNLSYDVSYKSWYVMYFFAILTHWFIDACTSYGTQIFEPFSSYRISFNNISIVDPLYTVPFLIALTLVFWSKKYSWRRFWNWTGLGLSTAYMIFTFVAKNEVNKVVELNLKNQNINYIDYTSSPLIFNTILWQAMVETDSNFYYGMYSLLDAAPKINFVRLPKNHHLITPYKDNELVKIILWFAQGYYNIEENEDGSLKFHNLRFGLTLTNVKENKYTYIVHYVIKKDTNGQITVKENRQNPSELNINELLTAFWTRLKGI